MKDKNRIPLTKKQKEVMGEFYNISFKQVVLSKNERMDIWKKFKNGEKIVSNLVKICPAAFAEIQKAQTNDQNLQSAVFSECAYAQTLANILNLCNFTDYTHNPSFVSDSISSLLNSYNLVPRYIYSNNEKSRMLIQAGGCIGVDSALISVLDNDVYTIEFKEAGAKTSEPDLPKYGEDGKLILTDDFKQRYPQFTEMMKQHIGFNVFEKRGHNENNFSPESIRIAVTENYTSKKFADVICTEDKSNYLTMLPANQVDRWAVLQGEIRTAGRNPYSVWTPKALLRFIKQYGGNVSGEYVYFNPDKLEERKPRGGSGSTGYKITSLFFVRKQYCKKEPNGDIKFKLNNIEQLNPTIAAKMFFYNLNVSEVKEYYKSDLKN
ncbi:MAG: hypothetical protein FWB77_04760 [Treponema sp.]|nr:hypothetical protein [Treponema sp.]